MRLNLHVCDGDTKKGYENTRHVNNLHFVDDSEAREISALNVLDYLPAEQIPEMISYWITKLGKNGTIELGGTSYASVARKIYQQQIDVLQVNSLFYGNMPPKRSLTSLHDIEMLLISLGVWVIQKRLDDETSSYYIKGAKQ